MEDVLRPHTHSVTVVDLHILHLFLNTSQDVPVLGINKTTQQNVNHICVTPGDVLALKKENHQ